MNLILGAGLAGLSSSYHLGHENCLLLERQGYAYGHIRSEFRDGFTWDEGPHVSFTKHEYVRDLFAKSVGGEFDEYEVKTANYFQGHWIDHPAQSALYQVPEPLRAKCLESFLSSRSDAPNVLPAPANYAEWLERAFGAVFAETFPAAYTRKYWTREPKDLTTDWVGSRVFLPNVEEVIAGSKGPLGRQTHYITKVRYPRKGGYQAFAASLRDQAQICFGSEVIRIDLGEKIVWTADGSRFSYDRLINTLPIPVFLSMCADLPERVRTAARALSCSSVLLVNVTAAHRTLRKENWMYVYDEEKYSTRINCTEKLTPGNAPAGCTGIQVEVYFSRYRPLKETPDQIAMKVAKELSEMGLLEDCRGQIHFHTALLPWANVIFDHDTGPALETIWSWLESCGLEREAGDTHPLTDWTRDESQAGSGCLAMAGRFGQWKYFWTDDCVLRGKALGA